MLTNFDPRFALLVLMLVFVGILIGWMLAVREQSKSRPATEDDILRNKARAAFADYYRNKNMVTHKDYRASIALATRFTNMFHEPKVTEEQMREWVADLK